MEAETNNNQIRQFFNNPRVPLLVLLGLGGVLLAYWAGDRLWSYLPYAVFLLCPLMHIFMHRNGHGGHQDGNQHGGHGAHGCCPMGGEREQDSKPDQERTQP